MSWEEKRSWLFLFGTAATYLGYVVVVLMRAEDVALIDVAYAWPMAMSILVSIAAHIVLSILAAVLDPQQADRRDERDDRIGEKGDLLGSNITAVFMLGTLALVFEELPLFWIGNGIYLAFFVGAQVGTLSKLVSYRRGF